MSRPARPVPAARFARAGSVLLLLVFSGLVVAGGAPTAAATHEAHEYGAAVKPFNLAWADQGSMQYPFALTIADERLYSSELHGHWPDYESRLVARDVATSKVLWSTLLGAGENPDGNGGIAVSQGLLLTEDVGSDLLAFDLNGRLQWRHNATQGDAWNPQTGPPATSSDVIARVVEGAKDWLVATDYQGELLWQVERPHSHGAPVAHDGTIVHVAYGDITAWRPDGTQAWSMHPPAAWSRSPPAVGTHLYVVDLRGSNDAGTIHITAIDDGSVAWTRAFDAPQWPPKGDPPRIYRPAAGNGAVAFNAMGLIGALDAATGEPKWTLPTNLTYRTPPVIIGDTVVERGAVNAGDRWLITVRDIDNGGVRYQGGGHQFAGQAMPTAVGDGFFATASGGPVGDLLVYGPDHVPPTWPACPDCDYRTIHPAGDGEHDDLLWGEARDINLAGYRVERKDEANASWTPWAPFDVDDHRATLPPEPAWYRVVAIDAAGNEAPGISLQYQGSWHTTPGGGGGGSSHDDDGNEQPTQRDQPANQTNRDDSPPAPEQPDPTRPEDPPKQSAGHGDDVVAARVDGHLYFEAGTFGISDRNPAVGTHATLFARLTNPHEFVVHDRVDVVAAGVVNAGQDVRLEPGASVLWTQNVTFWQEGDQTVWIGVQGRHGAPNLPGLEPAIEMLLPVGDTTRATAATSIVVSAGLLNVGTVASGEVRTVPVSVTAYNGDAHGVRLQVIDAAGLTVQSLTPGTTVEAGQTVQFYLRITGQDLAENATAANANLVFQAVAADGLASNAETITVLTHHEDLRGIPFVGAPAVAAAVATGGGLLALFRRRYGIG